MKSILLAFEHRSEIVHVYEDDAVADAEFKRLSDALIDAAENPRNPKHAVHTMRTEAGTQAVRLAALVGVHIGEMTEQHLATLVSFHAINGRVSKEANKLADSSEAIGFR